MLQRRNSRRIYVGEIPIGGGAPVVIQSMTNTPTGDVAASLAQIRRLREAGCQIVRLTVPDQEAVQALPAIIRDAGMPVLADIHFDYRLALAAIEAGVAGLRLNPGNIGGEARVAKVAQAAKAAGIPIRVGVNSGSLEKELLTKYGGVTAQGLAESALKQQALLERHGFGMIKLSVKASDVPVMVEAYRLLAQQTDCPFHIGVTEAGIGLRAAVKSAAGIGGLLAAGLGDTLRVSLTGDPVEEIFVAQEILRAYGLYQKGVQYIICPTCGRTQVDLTAIAAQAQAAIEALHIEKPLTVAVMGCVVNGPGEASAADIGIACGKGEGLLFSHGQTKGKYPEDKLVEVLVEEIKDFCQ